MAFTESSALGSDPRTVEESSIMKLKMNGDEPKRANVVIIDLVDSTTEDIVQQNEVGSCGSNGIPNENRAVEGMMIVDEGKDDDDDDDGGKSDDIKRMIYEETHSEIDEEIPINSMKLQEEESEPKPSSPPPPPAAAATEEKIWKAPEKTTASTPGPSQRHPKRLRDNDVSFFPSEFEEFDVRRKRPRAKNRTSSTDSKDGNNGDNKSSSGSSSSQKLEKAPTIKGCENQLQSDAKVRVVTNNDGKCPEIEKKDHVQYDKNTLASSSKSTTKTELPKDGGTGEFIAVNNNGDDKTTDTSPSSSQSKEPSMSRSRDEVNTVNDECIEIQKEDAVQYNGNTSTTTSRQSITEEEAIPNATNSPIVISIDGNDIDEKPAASSLPLSSRKSKEVSASKSSDEDLVAKCLKRQRQEYLQYERLPSSSAMSPSAMSSAAISMSIIRDQISRRSPMVTSLDENNIHESTTDFSSSHRNLKEVPISKSKSTADTSSPSKVACGFQSDGNEVLNNNYDHVNNIQKKKDCNVQYQKNKPTALSSAAVSMSIIGEGVPRNSFISASLDGDNHDEELTTGSLPSSMKDAPVSENNDGAKAAQSSGKIITNDECVEEIQKEEDVHYQGVSSTANAIPTSVIDKQVSKAVPTNASPNGKNVHKQSDADSETSPQKPKEVSVSENSDAAKVDESQSDEKEASKNNEFLVEMKNEEDVQYEGNSSSISSAGTSPAAVSMSMNKEKIPSKSAIDLSLSPPKLKEAPTSKRPSVEYSEGPKIAEFQTEREETTNNDSGYGEVQNNEEDDNVQYEENTPPAISRMSTIEKEIYQQYVALIFNSNWGIV